LIRFALLVAPIVVPAWGIWQQRHKVESDDVLAMGIVLGGMCVVVPVGLIAFLTVSQRRSRAALENGIPIVGEIWKKQITSGENSAWLVFVRWPDQTGTLVGKSFNVGPHAYEQLEIGDSLPVVIDPKRPRRAVLGPPEALPDTLRHLHEPHGVGCFMLIAWFFAALGLFMVWIGLSGK
jgi:hypothetical protein